MIEGMIERVDKAIEIAKNDLGTKLLNHHFQLEGMSSRENKILLNELLNSDSKYLEIGVNRGSTFCSAIYKNEYKTAVAIDNWSQFGGKEIKDHFVRNAEFEGNKNYTLIEADCFALSDEQKELVRDANVYFYDGDHRAIDQEMALTYYYDLLPNEFIFIVDDWNHGPARDGTRLGLEKTGLKIHKEWILDGNTTHRGWHNGLYVAVLSKN